MTARGVRLGLTAGVSLCLLAWSVHRMLQPKGPAHAALPTIVETDEPLPSALWRFPDVPLTTHEGRRVRFYEDLVKGKIVSVNFMYVECDGICPGLTSSLVEAQKELGERMGRDVLFLSITLQPETDTPERLKEYARRYGAGPGMIFLTGAPEQIERLRRALGFSYPLDPRRDGDRKQHMGILRLGNEKANWWTACASVSSSAQIVRLLRSLDPVGPGDGPGSQAVVLDEGVPTREGSQQDRVELQALWKRLDRLHMNKGLVGPRVYSREMLGATEDFLGLDPKGRQAFEQRVAELLEEMLSSRKRMESTRKEIRYNPEDPQSVEATRDLARSFRAERQRLLGSLDSVLPKTPRGDLFRSQNLKWAFFMEDHPAPEPARQDFQK